MIRKLKTHCKRGHEFTHENTYTNRGKGRWCRRCMYDRSHAFDKKTRIKHPERYRKYLRKNYDKMKLAGLCLVCRVNEATVCIPGGNRGKRLNSCERCRSEHNRTKSERRLALKIEVLTHYGPDTYPNCSWENCDVTDIDMLTIDHIDNSGANDRRGITAKGGITFYARLKRAGYPQGFQTLCHNHQWKKEITLRRALAAARNPILV